MRQIPGKKLHTPLLLALGLLLHSCSTSAPGLFAKKTPHQLYGEKISNAGLRQTALGKRWFSVADEALSSPLSVSLPYQETGYFAAENPESAGLQFSAKRGEKLNITLEKKPASGFLVYMDLWQVSDSKDRKPLATSDTTGSPIEFEVGKEDRFILRLQPELLKGGEYTISITTGPSLAFPVPSKAKPNVGSFWGAGRDNGARKHEGIDIFAPFRTPVIASADGHVSRVEETGLGGKVVWLRPRERSLSLYYAHLDSQIAKPGQTVRAGDTLGLLGNTGNAKTTAPHLHFGVYAIGGAVDPFPFVNPSIEKPSAVTASLALLGKHARSESKTSIYQEPELNTTASTLIDGQTLMAVKAATRNWYKVTIPSGEEGFIPANLVTGIGNRVRKFILKNAAPMLDLPDSTAAHKRLLTAGKSVNVLAVFGNYYYVEAESTEGWMLKNCL